MRRKIGKSVLSGKPKISEKPWEMPWTGIPKSVTVRSVSFRVRPADLELQGYELWTVIPYWSDYKVVDAIKDAIRREGYKHIIVRKVSKWGRVETEIWGKK